MYSSNNGSVRYIIGFDLSPCCSVPLQRILKSVCQRKQLDHTLHAVALPPDSAHGQPLLCQPTMTVGDLKSYEIHLIRKDTKPVKQEVAEEKPADQVSLAHTFS